MPLTLPTVMLSPPLIRTILFIALLIAASVIDIRKRVIPDSICAMIALTGLICFSPVKLFGLPAALPLLIPALCREGSIGGGDIKLTAAVGMVLGFEGGIAGLVIGLAAMLLFFAGSKVVGRLWGSKNRKRNEAALPMAPFLSTGFIAVYVFMISGA
jgi:leader peptidase (prepilin peptidase)/N-methyltransferase